MEDEHTSKLVRAIIELMYSQDFYGWTQEQSRLLRDRKFEQLDLENLIEEIESMGRSEKRELKNRLAILLMHLLKWEYQPNKRSRSWELTIKEQRLQLSELLSDNPSLKNNLEDVIVSAYPIAIIKAQKETGLENFPEECPFVKKILDLD